MSSITIKTSQVKEALPLIKDAIELEKRVIKDSISTTNENIKRLTALLNINVKDLTEGKVEYTEENEMFLLELEGELEFLRRLENKLRKLQEFEICA